MNKLITLLLVSIPVWVFAQQTSVVNAPQKLVDAVKTIEEQQDFISRNVLEFALNDEFPEIQLASHFKQSYSALQHKQVQLQLAFKRSSMMGEHFLFNQTYNNIPVYGAYLKVNLSKTGKVISVIDHLTSLNNVTVINALLNQLVAYYILHENTITPVIKVGNVLLDESGNTVKVFDTKFYFTMDDTLVSGKVFNHDPLTTAGVIYGQGGTYKHFNDSDYVLLNNQRVDVTFPGTYNSGVFTLESDYAIIQDFAGPAIAPATSTVPVFDFTRKQSGFKDVMAYYHVLHTRDYLHSLGFTGLMQYQQRIDAHATTADQSYFDPSDKTLNFGLGGVPDAEDADVITHEYTHAISFDINPTPSMQVERRAIEEGICDVMAAVQSRKTTTYNWRLLFNFDGPNPVASGNSSFWGGRNGASSKTYFNYQGDPYRDCEIWTSCLLDIAEDIGHDTLMILMFNAVYNMTASTTMPQAAQMLLDADSILFDKRHVLQMGYRFNQRMFGNFPQSLADINELPLWFKIYNTFGFAQGNGNAVVSNTSLSSYQITVTDLSGNTILASDWIKDDYTLQPHEFKSGIYILSIIQNGRVYRQKLIRY